MDHNHHGTSKAVSREGMSPSELKIRSMLVQIAGIGQDAPAHAHLYDDLSLASVHAVSLLLQLEESFGVHIPDGEFVEATTIAKLVNMIEGLTGQHASAS